MTRKPVYRVSCDGAVLKELMGHAATWAEVAALLEDKRVDAVSKLSNEHSESRTAFYVKVKP